MKCIYICRGKVRRDLATSQMDQTFNDLLCSNSPVRDVWPSLCGKASYPRKSLKRIRDYFLATERMRIPLRRKFSYVTVENKGVTTRNLIGDRESTKITLKSWTVKYKISETGKYSLIIWNAKDFIVLILRMLIRIPNYNSNTDKETFLF